MRGTVGDVVRPGWHSPRLSKMGEEIKTLNKKRYHFLHLTNISDEVK
jgi:hypothetical protein